jgi:hypothetical protein
MIWIKPELVRHSGRTAQKGSIFREMAENKRPLQRSQARPPATSANMAGAVSWRPDDGGLLLSIVARSSHAPTAYQGAGRIVAGLACSSRKRAGEYSNFRPVPWTDTGSFKLEFL